MTQLQIYTYGLESFSRWGSGEFKWMLMKSGSFTRTNHFVSDLVPATNELDVGSYARIAVATESKTTTSTQRQYKMASNPTWGSMTAGTPVVRAVLYEHVTNDSDSILVGALSISSVDSGVAPFTIDFTGLMAAYSVAGSGS